MFHSRTCGGVLLVDGSSEKPPPHTLCNALLQQSLCNLQIYFLYHSSPAMFWDRDCIDRANIWTVVLYFLQVSSPLPSLSICSTTLFSLSSYLENVLQGSREIFYKTLHTDVAFKILNTCIHHSNCSFLPYDMHTFMCMWEGGDQQC